MQNRGSRTQTAGGPKTVRASAVLAFAVWFVLASLPLPPHETVAAPPEPDSIARSGLQDVHVRNTEARAAPGLDGATLLEPASREPGVASRGPEPAPARSRTNPGSVRPRGREAPVQLRQSVADPLDGVAEKDGDKHPREQSKVADRKPRKRERPERGIRVWPMPAQSYTFTQAFGCVPQIAHFYQPGAGCPADAPVIHHGIDMAAPEGTLFYAAASGWVTEAGYDREVGVANTRIIIQHDDRNEDYATEYLHWIASFVDIGDYVEAGEAIGEVGSVGYSTGPHLHFSVIDLKNGGNLDPVAWLPDEPGTDGYRGKLPDERAEMRLPAGTTAGVPEWHDPNPPPPPERQEVPESPPDRDRSDRKRKKDKDGKERKERRAGKRHGSDETDADSRVETADESDNTKADAKDKKAKGKNKERTRKRERVKNGSDEAKAADGEDGRAKRGKGKRGKGTRDKGRHDDRGDRRSSGHSGKRDKDDIDQRGLNGNDRGNNGNKDKRKDKDREKSSADTPGEKPPADDDVSQEPPAGGEPQQDDGNGNPDKGSGNGDQPERGDGNDQNADGEAPGDGQNAGDSEDADEKRRAKRDPGNGGGSGADQTADEKRGEREADERTRSARSPEAGQSDAANATAEEPKRRNPQE